jgi:hypothetical protein
MLWLLWECGGIVQLMLYSFQPGVMEQINAGVLIGDKTTPGTVDGICNHIFDTVSYGFPVPDFEGFDKSLGKHHRGYRLYGFLPHRFG